MHIPPEPPAIVEDMRPPSLWPSKGRIELQHLKIRYRLNAPLILKGITRTFRERSRVGIVGRNGSGKTTLITALFRLLETDNWRILVDGFDICSIGLKDLRMKISFISQEPTLFRGSVRTNMEPLGLYTDDDIWKASPLTSISLSFRVPTVIDSDMVMVLSFGKLLEYEESSKLMQDTNSSFFKLVAEYWSSCRKSTSQSLKGKDHH